MCVESFWLRTPKKHAQLPHIVAQLVPDRRDDAHRCPMAGGSWNVGGCNTNGVSGNITITDVNWEHKALMMCVCECVFEYIVG